MQLFVIQLVAGWRDLQIRMAGCNVFSKNGLVCHVVDMWFCVTWVQQYCTPVIILRCLLNPMYCLSYENVKQGI